MADILIKLDKGIPKTHESLVIDEDNEVRIYGTGIVIGEAIELPEHGEAKDTDIAIKYIKSEMEDDFNETTTLDEKSYKEGMKRAIELIGYAPTVLEANNGNSY